MSAALFFWVKLGRMFLIILRIPKIARENQISLLTSRSTFLLQECVAVSGLVVPPQVAGNFAKSSNLPIIRRPRSRFDRSILHASTSPLPEPRAAAALFPPAMRGQFLPT